MARQKSLWEITYSILFSFNKKDDVWDGDARNVVASTAEEAIEKTRKSEMKKSDFMVDDKGNPLKKKWHVAGFRLTGVKELNSIDIL